MLDTLDRLLEDGLEDDLLLTLDGDEAELDELDVLELDDSLDVDRLKLEDDSLDGLLLDSLDGLLLDSLDED